MHMEACAIVRDWLDGARGLNQWLTAIPVKDGTTLKPIDQFVCRDTDPSMVQGKYPQVMRLITVESFGPSTVDKMAAIGTCDTKDLQILVRYVVRSSDSVSARREAGYVLRALRQCLFDLTRFAGDGDCTREGVVLLAGGGIKTMPLSEAADNCSLMGVCVMTLQLRDTVRLPST